MDTIIWLFLRRMRAPLIVLISAYAVSVGGLVLIPGVDGDGNPWRFDFLHAFYFVSFMGSTIGFGEIPHEFTAGQRLWVTVCIFLAVFAWLYAIGRILTLMQDTALRGALAEARFIRAVRGLTAPFWVICGFGETGSLLVRSLARRGVQCVVMEQNPVAMPKLLLEQHGPDIPAFCGNASETLHLLEAGVRRRLCRGIVALTDDDGSNVRIAITAKLMRPELQVIARAGTRIAADNLASFGTDHVIHPYQVFAEHLRMTQRLPSLHLLHAWLISLPNRRLQPPVTPPCGAWVVCGYGRFGRAVAEALEAEGNTVRVIESNPDKAPEGAVVGRGTEAGPLQQAGISDAVGIVCGTDSDHNTLSAVLTARALKPDIYVIARQDREADADIFRAAHVDLVMEPSRIMVWRILPLIKTPFMSRFLRLMRGRTEAQASDVLERVRALCDGVTPETWSVGIDEQDAPAVHAALLQGATVHVADLIRNPAQRAKPLPCLPLMLVREDDDLILPAPETALQAGDRLLFTARHGTRAAMEWTLFNAKGLEYAVTGVEHPDGWLWRWWARRRAQRRALHG